MVNGMVERRADPELVNSVTAERTTLRTAVVAKCRHSCSSTRSAGHRRQSA
jgi:hypothetical protein